MVPTPKAVRVKTSEGWQDIAMRGPQGAPSGQMVFIEEKVLAADAAIIDFQNIPQIYSHLELRCRLRGTGVGPNVMIRFNNDAGASQYDWTRMLAHASASGSEGINQTSGYSGGIAGSNSAGGRWSQTTIRINDYIRTDFHKTYDAHSVNPVVSSTTGMVVFYSGGVWKSTAAIDRVTLSMDIAGNFLAGSRVALYGIKAEPEGIRQNWSDVYCETTLGITNLGAIAANGLWTLLPIPAAPKLIITKADGVNDDFTRNADGTITINKAGNYHISCSLGAGDQWADGVNINYGIAKKAGVQPGAGDTWVATDNRTAGATGNNYPGGTVAGTTFCNAGDRIAIWLWHNAGATKPINLHTFSIHRTGAGPPGPIGTPIFLTTGRFAGNGGTVGAGGQHIGGNSLVYTPIVPVRAQINWKSRWDKVDANWGYCAGGPVFSPLPVADYDGLDAAPVLGQRVLRDLLSGYGGADPYKALKGTFFVDLAANVTYTIMNSFYAGAGTWQWDSSWFFNHIDLMAWPR